MTPSAFPDGRPKSPRSVESFHEALALSSRRLGFSVTQGCPLRCGHCSVGAAPELHANRYGRDFTGLVVGQLDALAEAGIESIDFTGGEPTLVADFVATVSRAASARGITCGIVTAAHWATTERQIDRTLERFGAIDHWDISTDVYHLEFVPLRAVESAFRRLEAAGKEPLIRIAYHEPMTVPDAELIQAAMAFAGRRVAFQPIGPVGRGIEVAHSERVGEADWDRGPCPTTGPLVQWNGRVAPCCAPASHETHDHPLWLGDARQEPLTTIVARWRTHPLIQTLRVWGFAPLRAWFSEAGVADGAVLRERACDLCVQWLRDPQLCALAAERAGRLEHRVRLAHALLTHFEEPWLDRLLQQEARRYLATGSWPEPGLLAA
ncbi:MAG: radical SAM protein [Tistlia sp.]|uniref:radical SAM protein n=1 Tax=Tistlia sp. TaxID=3057121 RepID=UPI0034A42B56